MDKIFKNNLLRLFEVFAIYLVLISFILVIRLYFFNVHALVYSIYLFIVLAFGFIIGLVIIGKNNYYTLGAVLLFGIFIFPLLVLSYMNKVLLIFDCICVLILYIVGVKSSKIEFGNILSQPKVVFGIISFTLLLLLCHFVVKINSLKNTIFILAIIFMFIGIIIRNQDNLTDVFIRRGIDASKMQNIIRNYNLYVSLFLFCIIIIAFNGKVILEFLLSILKTIFLYLLSLFPESVNEEIIEEVVKIEDPSLALGDPTPYTQVHPIMDFLYNVLRNFIVIYLLFKLSLFILKTIKKTIKKILNLFSRFFSKTFKPRVTISIEYSDEITFEKNIENKKQNSSHLKLKKLQKLYNGTNNPILKIRFTYKMMLIYLRKHSEILNSMTTGEISSAYTKYPSSKDIKDITSIYEKTVYGDKIIESDTIGNLSNKINNMKKATPFK